MGLIADNFRLVNPPIKTVFKTFKKYKPHIINALEMPYSNAKIEATNKLINNIKHQAFGFRNFAKENHKKQLLHWSISF